MTNQLSRRELCKAIYDQLPSLPRKDMIDVFKQTQQMVPPEKFIIHADGSRLSLDSSIPDDVLVRMHTLICSKLNYETNV